MYLKSVELSNFQKHDSLKIDFINGINVLSGSSDVGKSSIRRAIEWILFNKNIDGIRKEGTKQTSVIVEIDNGAVIERVRSASINRYILRKDGDEMVFDSIGKTIPDEIKDAIGITPINIDGEEIYLNSAPQIALPFLFDRSPSWRAKLFNTMTGADLLDKLFSTFNKDLLRINRDHKTATERLEMLAEKIESQKTKKEQLEAVHSAAKKHITSLKEKIATSATLVTLRKQIESNKVGVEAVKISKSKIKIPEPNAIKELTSKINDFEAKKSLCNALLSNDKERLIVDTKLSNLCIPDVNSDELVYKNERLQTLKWLEKNISANTEYTDAHKKQTDKISNDIGMLIHDLDLLLQNMPECPMCGQDMNEECIERMKNE